MPLIPEDDARAVRAHLAAHLTAPVTVDYFTRAESKLLVPGRECDTCDDTRTLLEEVAGLSEQIRLNVHDLFAEGSPAAALEVDRIPAIVLGGGARGRVRYYGIPAGYEFGSFLEELIEVASGRTDLKEETKEALKGLERDVHIRVFVTPSCPFCPAAARLAHKMAVESEKVTADVVEASAFPDLVERYRVRGVPKVVVNETVEFTGAQPEARFLAHVLRAAA
jgi:glutaredoxin-like protein